jgi:MoaA/NifB/PqqE/SkfB family radical SAM enzyme
VTLELYPTLSCNLDCAFCDTTDRHRPPVDELSRDELLALVDEAADLGVRRVFVLGGGEPLARKDAAPALLARIKNHGLEGILTTNGTLLGPVLARQLVETGWDEVHVSIDAPDAATHDRLRGREGAFRRTVRNTCRLSQLRRRLGRDTPRVALHFVLTRLNWRTLPEMIDLAVALGAFRVDFDALIAYTPEQQALQLTADERAAVPQVARRAIERAQQHGIQTTLHHFLHPERLDRGNTVVEIPPEPGLRGAPCLKAWHYLVVQADGRTSPCCVLAGEGGSVRGRGLGGSWREDPFLNTVRDGMLAKAPLPRCRECTWNILAHEAEVRTELQRLPPAPGVAPWG